MDSIQHSMAADHMFPIEIFEAIIDQASDDTISLRHLSLTCNPFLSRARCHLFSSILLQNAERAVSFSEFLDSHPWAGPLVRKLVHSTFIPISASRPVAPVLDIIPFHLLSRLPNLHTWEMGMAGVKRRSEVGAWLSCHDSALSSYQNCSSLNVRNLELAYVHLEDISDFIGLVSAFTHIDSLICSHIWIKSSLEIGHHPSAVEDTRGRSVRLRSLRSSIIVDIRVLEYLLDSSRTTLNKLALTFESHQSDEYFERLAASVSSLSLLSSLSFVLPSTTIAGEIGGDFWGYIHFSRRIVESVKSIHAQDVRVEFKPDPVASLGCCLSSDPRALEGCGALEEALLTFPRPHILFHDAVFTRRAGRWGLWSATIKGAFPRLSERESLSFPDLRSNIADPVGHEAAVMCLVTSLGGQRVVTASRDGSIIVWNAGGGTILQEWFAHGHGVRTLALSPDGRRLVSAGGRDETLTVWDISNNDKKPVVAAVLEGHTKAVTACAWSPDDALIASASADGTVRVWDAQKFEQRDHLLDDPRLDGFGFHPLLFSPNSRFLAWTSIPSPTPRYGCTIWCPLMGEQPKRLPSHSTSIGSGTRVKALSFNPESTRIATAHVQGRDHHENIVRIWDVATGARLVELVGHEMILTDVSFSPDGRSILSASCDSSVRIWDVDGGRETTSLTVSPHSVPTACFSPDGKYVAAASWAGTVHLWRVADGSSIAVFTEHAAAVVQLAFCSDGEYLISGDMDGAVCFHHLAAFCGH